MTVCLQVDGLEGRNRQWGPFRNLKHGYVMQLFKPEVDPGLQITTAKQHLEDTICTGRANCIMSRSAPIHPWNLPSCHSTCNRGCSGTGPDLLCKRVNGACHNGWQQGIYWLTNGSYEGYFSFPSLTLDKQCRTCPAEKKPSIYPI